MLDRLQKIEQANIAKEKVRNPHLFKEPTFIDDKNFLARFGINIPKEDMCTNTYVKMYPHDFIVEEIDIHNQLQTIEYCDNKKNPELQEIRTWLCTLVKCNLTTIEATKDICNKLKIPMQNISYAGIKDKQAITSQKIAIQNVTYESVTNIKSEFYFIKDIELFKGKLDQGSLKGNRFTLNLRSDKDLSGQEFVLVKKVAEDVKENGYYNFFYLQRFGIPRFLSHIWGMYILQDKHAELIKSILFEDCPNELEFFRNLRKKSKGLNNLNEVKKIYSDFPIYLGQENALLDAIDSNGNINFQKIKSYVQLWISAFSSLLWNEKLSSCIKEGYVPESIPLVTNSDSKELYNSYLEYLDMPDIGKTISKNLPFISTESKSVQTKGHVTDLEIEAVNKNIKISFSLPKGSYATCMLSHIVDIVSGTPLPNTNRDKDYELVSESSKKTIEYFKPIIDAGGNRIEE